MATHSNVSLLPGVYVLVLSKYNLKCVSILLDISNRVNLHMTLHTTLHRFTMFVFRMHERDWEVGLKMKQGKVRQVIE